MTGATQLYVEQGGTVLIDEATHCAPDALFWIFSASKPFTAVLVHRLVERGELDLDEPIAAHWPGFGRNGKQAITVRQVLQHRTGLVSQLGREGLVMADWNRSVRRAEGYRPEREIGGAPGYLPLSYGFILGELLRRMTGTPLPELLRREVPGLTDTYLGLPDHAWPRHVPLRVEGRLGRLVRSILNRRATRQAVIPAAGVSTTARDLGRFYRALLDNRLLRPDTLAEACRPTDDSGYIRWAQGFQLGASRAPLPSMGRRSGPRTFGHNGSNCCIAWADPDRDLVFAYLTDRVPSREDGARQLVEVADPILERVQLVR
jgi:CubicO group peptidase (beta-lactamase class C family)